MSTPTPPFLFRPEAVAELDAGRRLDTRLTVAPPRAWLALVVLVLIVIAVAVWSVLGRAPVVVSGNGILLPPDGLIAVQSPVSGVVVGISHPDDEDPSQPQIQVGAGTTLLTVKTDDGATRQVTTQIAGTLIVREPLGIGSSIDSGNVVAQLLPDGEDTVALMFVSPDAAAQIKTGMAVRMSAGLAPASAYGELLGSVRSVDDLPYDRTDFLNLAGQNTELAAQLAFSGQVRVVVDLRTAATPSGYAWTSQSGPPFRLPAAALLSGEVELGEKQPLSFLLEG
jgi:hypothetical protein